MDERKKVVLVRCEVPTRVTDAFIPNNLLTLSESLLRAGYEPEIIDMRVEDYRTRIPQISWEEVVCVGISTLTGPQIQFGLDFCSRIRQVNASLPLIWGGAHPSLRPDQTARHPLCDIVVRGEGEKTLPELMGKLRSGKSFAGVPGITYVMDGKLCSTPDRPWVDLDSIGLLPYQLIDMNKYDISANFAYHTSRGCPHRCGFCINHTFQKSTYRAQSAEIMVENIKHIVSTFGVSNFHFTDDNFFVNRNRVERFCRLVIGSNLNIRWVTGCRFDYFSRFSSDFLSLLKESGCSELGYGAESGSARVLNYIEKGIKPNQVVESVKRAKAVGLRLSPVSFMYGFPEETLDDLNESVDLIDTIRRVGKGNTIVNGMFLLTPYPGTPIADDLEKRGYKFPAHLEDWSSYLMSGGQKRTDWLDLGYLRIATTVSNMIRFRYFVEIRAHKKLKSPLLRFAYFLFTFPFYWSERVRWRTRFFKWGYEWRLWAWVRTRFLGVT